MGTPDIKNGEEKRLQTISESISHNLRRENGSNTEEEEGDRATEEQKEEESSTVKDRGYAWVIMFGAFLFHVVIDGVAFSFGIFLLEFLDYFNESREKTSWVGSVMQGYGFMGPLSCALCERFGYRVVAMIGALMAGVSFFVCTFSPNVNILILTYGALGGISIGLTYFPSVVILGHYFDQRRAFATGIAVSGSGVGTFIFAPLTNYLISTYAWRGATWIIAGIVLNLMVVGALFRPFHEPMKELKRKDPVAAEDQLQSVFVGNKDAGSTDAGNSKKTLHTTGQKMSTIRNISSGLKQALGQVLLLKNPVFAIYCASCLLCMLGFFIPFNFLPDFAVSLNVTKTNAAFLISIIGIVNTCARVICGWVSDRSWADSLLINNVALMLAGLATFACPFLTNYGLLAAYCCIFGAGIAVFVSLRSIIVIELLGLEMLDKSFGLVAMSQGLSAFVGPPIAGLLYDVTKSYQSPFFFAGATIGLAGLICLPLRRINRWQMKRDGKMDNTIREEPPQVEPTVPDCTRL